MVSYVDVLNGEECFVMDHHVECVVAHLLPLELTSAVFVVVAVTAVVVVAVSLVALLVRIQIQVLAQGSGVFVGGEEWNVVLTWVSAVVVMRTYCRHVDA